MQKWGGKVSDYAPIHDFFDATKQSFADFRHRALRHHAEGIFECEKVFGPTLTLSTGRVIPTRWVGEQHVREDLGRIPSAADWLKCLRPEPWMLRVAVTHREIEPMPADSAYNEQVRINNLARQHTLWLLKLVYETVLERTESLDYSWFGEDLAYLMGAILRNTHCEWPESRPLVQLLQQAFPEDDHPVWNHVRIEEDDDPPVA